MLTNITYGNGDIRSDSKTFFSRPNICGMLNEAVHKPLITVIAGAGYGKTQSVSEFLQNYNGNAIWLHLSALDNLIPRFWDRFVVAVSSLSEKISLKLEALGFPNNPIAFNKFIQAMLSEKVSNNKFFIILDNFHTIHEKAVLQFVENLVNQHLGKITVIIISREEPDINTIGLQAKGLLSNINEDNLRLSKWEMSKYFNNNNIILSEQVILNIYEYTEGWMFATYLIGLILEKNVLYDTIPLPAVKEDIFKLIEIQIFSLISEELQIFLIKLSLLEYLSLELLEELSSHNSSLLEQMKKIHSFIYYDQNSKAYYIRHLFWDFLNKKQADLSKEETEEIYLKAAKWYTEKGHFIDAINCYEKVNNYENVLNVVMNYSGTTSREVCDFMIELLNKVPQEFYNDREILHVIRAKFLFNSLKMEEAYKGLYELRAKYEALPDTKENKAILGEAYIMLGMMNFITCLETNKYDFAELFKKADEFLPNGSILLNSNFHLNVATYVCMVKYPHYNLLDQYCEIFGSVMPTASRVMNGCAYGIEFLALTEVAFYKYDFRKAEKCAYQAIHKSKEKGQFDIEMMALFYLIRINIARGNVNNIQSFIEELGLIADTHNCTDCYTIYDIIMGWFYAVMGQTNNVMAWLKNDIESEKVMSPCTFSLDRLVRAKCFLIEKKHYELIAFVERNYQTYSLNDFLLGNIEYKVIKTVALYYVNEKEEALKTLEEAYKLADSNRIITPFIEYGNQMRTIIKSAKSDENCKIPKEWLERIYSKSTVYAKQLNFVTNGNKEAKMSEHPLSAELSKREIDILTNLCHGMTREEISTEFDLSINTIKSMLQNIYYKLGAINSLDAVRIAVSKSLVK